MLAGAAIGVVVIAFRDFERQIWLLPTRALDDLDDLEEEPFLGYDGMDVDTLLDWLSDAGLDPSTLARMREYEAAHLGREVILSAIDDRLGAG